ncbi:MAG: HdeD family acid-resistance protein [Chloroflexota bacterium]|jgi:uncharacterized membrane protein HdeD (DUF308 family)
MENPTTPVQAWWVLAIAGVVSILFGLAAMIWPGITLIVLVWLFGVYVLVYGIVELVGMFRAAGQGAAWWTHLLIGLISIAAGLFILFNPFVSSTVLVFTIGFWAIFVGLVEIIASLTQAQILYLVTGIISVLFGFVLLSNPVTGALALIWVIGVFAIIRGILLLIGAFRAPAGAGWAA